MSPFEIKWSAPDFEYREKGEGWYWATISAAVVLVGFAIYEKNFLFGFFIVIAEILLISWANRKPNFFDIEINERGVEISGGKLREWGSFESFGIREYGAWPELILHPKNRLGSPLRVKMSKEAAPVAEEALQSFMPKVETEESFLETLERHIGF